jgi:hypothetical protein
MKVNNTTNEAVDLSQVEYFRRDERVAKRAFMADLGIRALQLVIYAIFLRCCSGWQSTRSRRPTFRSGSYN